MSGLDKNKKKIQAADIKTTTKIRADKAAKEKPSEKVAEFFKRKAHE